MRTHTHVCVCQYLKAWSILCTQRQESSADAILMAYTLCLKLLRSQFQTRHCEAFSGLAEKLSPQEAPCATLAEKHVKA